MDSSLEGEGGGNQVRRKQRGGVGGTLNRLLHIFYASTVFERIVHLEDKMGTHVQKSVLT